MGLRERAVFSSLLKAILSLRWFAYTMIWNWLKTRQNGQQKTWNLFYNIASNRVEKQWWAFNHARIKPVLQQIRLLQDAEPCYRKWRVVLRVWPRWLNIHLVYFVCFCFCVFFKELGQYLAILTSLFVNNANILEITFCLLLQIYETVETINQLKINREFFLGFARDPPVRKWKYHEFEILF